MRGQTLSSSSLTFGTVAVSNTSTPAVLTLTNNQGSAVSLSAPTVMGDFAVASTTCSTTLAPTQSCMYQVTFTPTLAGARTGTFTANVTGGVNPAPVTLAGTGSAPVGLSTSTVNFGFEAVGGTSPAQTVTISNYQAIPVSLGIQLTGSEFAISSQTCGATLSAFSSCTVSMTFAPLGVGPRPTVPGSASLTVQPGSFSALVATLVGVGGLPAELVPSAISFGNEAVGSTSRAQSVTLYNHTNSSATFTQPVVSAPFAVTGGSCVALSSLPANSSCNFTITFTPGSLAAAMASVTVPVSVGSSPLTVALSGSGSAATAVIPSSLNFGTQGLATSSSTMPVQVYNYQSVAVTLTAPVSSGEYAVTGGTCGAVLAPNSSCSYLVTFTPALLGTRNASLNLASNASNSPLSVSLTGVGVTPVQALPGTLNFGNSYLGVSATPLAVTVTNYQAVALHLQAPATTGDYAVTGGTCISGMVAAGSTCTYLVTFTPQAAGVRAGTLSVVDDASNSPQMVALTGVGVNSPASLFVVTPGAAQAGTTVNVLIVGRYTHFLSGSGTPTVSFGTGITASNIVVVDDTHVTAKLTIAANAVPGGRNVSVSFPASISHGVITPAQFATITAGFVVSTASGLTVTNVVPSSAMQGQTLDVNLTASGSHFAAGTTIASFGDGITVNSVTVIDALNATANVTVSNFTTPGSRVITLVTGGEFVLGAFAVTQSPATLVSVTPVTAVQGSNLTLTLQGANTHFLSGASMVSAGSGINIGQVTVVSPLTIQVAVAVTPSAATGPHSLTVSTGGEVVTLGSGFNVTGGTPTLVSVSPGTGQQGTTEDVTFTGLNTNWQAGSTSVTFGSNITVNSVTVTSATSVTANISIDQLAILGGRAGILTAGSTDFPFSFSVTSSSARIATIVPGGALQGDSLAITLTGVNTHWSQANTTAAFANYPTCASVQVNRITVASPTSAILDVYVPQDACIGGQELIVSTGGEVVTGSFTVFDSTPTLNVSPGNGLPGTSASVNFTGQFTHFVAGTTTAVVDGQFVSLQNFTVTSPQTAMATVVIDAAALVATHTITLTTGMEAVTTPFIVSPTYLLSITPGQGTPGTTFSVEVRGVNTHFAAGQTTLGFGPDVTVSNLNIVSATDLTATVTIDATPALGWRSAFVNTGSEQLQIGFLISALSTSTPAIVGISPSSGAQGQSFAVQITAQNTHLVQGVTEAIVGAGITVANLAVTSPTTATATVTISPTAPLGGNTLVLITGSEIATGSGVAVTVGASQIVSATPSLVTQNQTLTVTLTGQATHWLQGETTASFGGGIAVDSLTIVDATHASAQITVLTTAALGFHAITLSTDGEIASLAQGLDVEQETPALLNSAPNSGQQGTTFNIQVEGSFTHWVQGSTVASFGTGVTVNSFTVQDSVTGLINVTINPTAYVTGPPCLGLTVTTGAEQVSLPGQLCIVAGAAGVLGVSPATAQQGQTLTVMVTGYKTNFAAGVTTANFGAGINTSNVQVMDATHATVDLAVTTTATTGFHAVTLSTLGENASLVDAFSVGRSVPTLNGCAPPDLEQGASATVQCIGQGTNWGATTTATFGQGVTVTGLSVAGAGTANVSLSVDPLAYIGGRTVTFTTGSEIEQASAFSVVASTAIISQVSPTGGNEGQEIVLTITGQNTHWLQGLTQFSVAGAGIDLTINNVIISSPTTATVDLTISTTASLGARSVYMLTAGEVLRDTGGFVVTGGIPSITTLSPNAARPGDQAVNVSINGLATTWVAGVTTVDFGPGITVQTFTVNNSTNITAVVNVDPAAVIGYRTVVVRTGSQGLTGVFQVLNPVTNPVNPAPYISYANPLGGLPGQTFTISFTGAYTKWDPATTQIVFQSGVTVNSFQVTSPTTARANITISPTASIGQQTITFTTNTETETVPFNIVQAVPTLAIVDPQTGMQGTSVTVNVIGQYTTFDQTHTVFNFGSGVTVTGQTILGPTVAQVTVSIDQLAQLGGRVVTETTGSETASYGYFSVTASQALITGISPNTAAQGTVVPVTVTGSNTHWDSSTTFSLGGGITVGSVNVTSATTATMSLTIAPLATVGVYNITAQTQGEIATLANAFVVQPGTPIILSSGPGSAPQQGSVTFTILGQVTNWVQGQTTVDLGPGVTVNSVTVTSSAAITVHATVQPTTPLGYRTITVTTGAQVLTLSNAFYVTSGPAAVASLSPTQGKQGQTLDVLVNGVNTNFMAGSTTANFGQGVTVNTVTVTSLTTATVNVTVSAYANPQLNSVTMSTGGETATGVSDFTIVQATPVLTFVNPASGFQSTTQNVSVSALFTHFNATTTFNFGAGITVNSVTVTSVNTATVNLTISPIAALGARNLAATTGTEVASGTGLFSVSAGGATLLTASPSSGQQNQSGINVTLTGQNTHFTQATPTVSFSGGVDVIAVQVLSDTSLIATVNVEAGAPVQADTVTVTTGGETASLAGGFRVTAGTPVVTSASPSSQPQGQTTNVIVYGGYTHFVAGQTTASFGAGVTVNTVTVNSATQATVNITVQPTATLGSRTVTMTTGSEVAAESGAFSVTIAVATASVTPTSAQQGQTVTLAITGSNTHFSSATTVSVSGAITTQSVTVNSATTASATIVIANGAGLGVQTVTVTTGSETATANFTVLAGTAMITVINPNTIAPTQTVAVTVTGNFTNWSNGNTTANFGTGISVGGAAAGAFGPVTVNSATQLTATLTTANAALGPQTVQIQTGAQDLMVNAGITIQSCSTTAPTVLLYSPLQSSVIPINTTFSFQFSVPMDRTTFSVYNPTTNPNGTVYLYDGSAGVYLPGTVSLDASGRIGTFVPATTLHVDRYYYLYLSLNSGLKDTCGNVMSAVEPNYTTGFTASTAGPALVGNDPVNGDVAVPTNAKIMLAFDRTLDPITAELGIKVLQAGNPVTGTFSFSSNGTQVTFSPTALAANTAYTVNYGAQITDAAGNALTAPGSFGFTTGSSAVTTGPQVVLVDPPNGATNVGINVQPHAIFSSPINPISLVGTSSAGTYLYTYGTGQYLGVSVAISADRLSATLTPLTALMANTQYYLYISGYTDAAGNAGGASYTTFTTGSSAITTAPTVLAVSPAMGASAIPLNANVMATLSAPVDPTSISSSVLTLSPAAPGTVTLGSDGRTLNLAPASLLLANTTYTATASGVKDQQGNLMTSFSWSFKTGAAADTTGLSVTSVSPAANATNVPVTSQVTLTFNKTNLDPLTVNASTVLIRLSSNGADVGGTYAVSNGVVTFTPYTQLPGNTQFYIYENGVMDTAGHSSSYGYSYFTTANTADTAPPAVVSISPANGTSNVGRYTQVVVTFNKSINPSTVNSTTVNLFGGDVPLNPYLSMSADNRTLTMTSNPLPVGAVITVVLSPAVQDLSGNALPAFTSQFTVIPAVPTATPSIVSMRPGSGATLVAVTTPITLFASAPLNAATLTSGLHVADNGVIVSGTLQSLNNGQAFEFTPSAPLGAGDTIQVYTDATVMDVYGNTLSSYTGSFTTAGSPTTTGPQAIATNPAYNTGSLPLNTTLQIEYNQPLDPATVTAANINFYNYSVGYQTATVALSSNHQVLLITPPGGLLTANTQYSITISSNVKNLSGQSASGGQLYFGTGSASDTTPALITSVTPTNGASNLGTNAGIAVTFNKAINPVSVTGSSIAVVATGAVTIPTSISFNSTYTQVKLTPQTPLPSSSQITITINGVTSPTGVAVAPQTTTFTTMSGPDFNGPVLINSSIVNGQSGVPTNATFALQFNKPIDPSTFNATNFYLYENSQGGVGGGNVAATITLSPDMTTVMLTPTQPLAVDHLYVLECYNLQDLSGNVQSSVYESFTTAFGSSSTGPQVAAINPQNGSTQVPINTQIQIAFSGPVNTASLGQISLTSGSTNVPFTTTIQSAQTILLVPTSPLSGSSPYKVAVTGVTDGAGNAMTSSVVSIFMTASSLDLVAPHIVTSDPVNSATNVGTNVAPHFTFNTAINPFSLVNGFANRNNYLYNNATSQYLPVTVTVSPDALSAIVTPTLPLAPNSNYSLYLGTYTDVAGNSGQGLGINFTTGGGAVTSAPTVTAVSPASGATGIALNPVVQIVLSAVIDPTSVANSAVTLSPAAAGTVTLASDGVTVSFMPSASLSASTVYTATASGLKDQQGNLMTPFMWSFTTGSAVDAAALTVTSVNPPANATGVSVNANVVVTFNKTNLDPLTINASTVLVRITTSGAQVGGTYTVSNGVVTFTPYSPLPGNTQFYIYISGVSDTAGHTTSAGYYYFTTANVADTTAPAVVSVSPVNGTANVGRYTQVVVTFSKSMNPQTINNTSNVNLFNGDVPLNPGRTISADNRTLTLNASGELPAGALITVELTSGVQDLSGNALPPFSSQFTVTPAVPNSAPTIVVMRPTTGATGVSLTSPITLFTSVPLNFSTVTTGLHVADNGSLIAGNVQSLSGGQGFVFTPSSPYGAGDNIQVFLDTTVMDIYGNSLSAYSGSFTAIGSPTTTGPQAIAVNPAYNNNAVPLNSQLQILFNQPLNPATVKASNINFYNYTIGYQTPTISLSNGNQLLTITPPGGSLSAGTTYNVSLSSNITNLSGQSVSGGSLYFKTGTTADNSVPSILYVTPPNGATNIGTNAAVGVTFSGLIDPVTVTSSTIALTGPGSTVIPASISFNSMYNQAILTPQEPLPSNTQIAVAVSGVTNAVGKAATAQTTTFTTMNGPDFSVPMVITSSVGSGQTVGTNAVFSAQFNKPIDPASFQSGSVYVYQYSSATNLAVTVSYSSDLTMIVLTPTSALTAGSYYFEVANMKDLSGNTQQGFSVSFMVGSGPVTTPLQILLTNPPSSSSVIATNATIQVLFSSPVANGGQVALTQGGTTVQTITSFLNGDTTIQLTPLSPLAANTPYTLTIAGVQDITGNPLTGSSTLPFTTGATIDLTAPTLVSLTPANGQTSVPDTASVVAVFSKPVNPISVTTTSFRLIASGAIQPVSGSFTFSPDYKTITFTPASSLVTGTVYNFYLSYYGNVTDQAGNALAYITRSFTAQ